MDPLQQSLQSPQLNSSESTMCCIIVPAQNFDQDILGDIVKGWNAFVSSGQIWALLIGIVLGYLFRSITK